MKLKTLLRYAAALNRPGREGADLYPFEKIVYTISELLRGGF